MSESASNRGWGPGWPSSSAAAHIVQAKCGANGIVLPVRREIAALCDHLVRALEKSRGRPFVQYGCWGYSNRAIRGTSVSSNHAWGLAIDLDAPNNGQGNAGYGTMPRDAGAIAARFGFRWGGSTRVGGAYTGTPDPMHYEYMGTPAQAAALTARLGQTGVDDMAALDEPMGIGRYAKNTPKQLLDAIMTTTQTIPTLTAKVAALEAAVDADPNNPVTQSQLDEAVAKGLAGANITIEGAGVAS